MIVVGFEPTPFRTGAQSQRLGPLGHTTFSRCSKPRGPLLNQTGLLYVSSYRSGKANETRERSNQKYKNIKHLMNFNLINQLINKREQAVWEQMTSIPAMEPTLKQELQIMKNPRKVQKIFKQKATEQALSPKLDSKALRASNMYLTKLSPHNAKNIKKPLLVKRSSILNRAVGDDNVDEDKETIDPNATLMNLKPTLELDEKHATIRAEDNKFSQTFGFSHGAGKRGAGNSLISVREQNLRPAKMVGVQIGHNSGRVNKVQDNQKFQVCFQIASKGSLVTQNMDQSMFSLAGGEHVLQTLKQEPNLVLLSQTQMKTLDEVMKDQSSPMLNEVESEVMGSRELLNRNKIESRIDAPSPDIVPVQPMQLISYMSSLKQSRDKQIKANPFNNVDQTPTSRKDIIKMQIIQNSEAKMTEDSLTYNGEHVSGSVTLKSTLAQPHRLPLQTKTHQKIPSLINNKQQAMMYKTTDQFPVIMKSDGSPRARFELKEDDGAETKGKLPQIQFSQLDDEVSLANATQTSMFPQTNIKFNNTNLQNFTASSFRSPHAKKFELPPNATIAVIDQNENIVKAATEDLAQMPIKTIDYTPKWTKKYNSRKGSQSWLGAPSGPPRHSSLPRSVQKTPPAFLIASPSSMNKTIVQSPMASYRHSFVNHYNMPKTSLANVGTTSPSRALEMSTTDLNGASFTTEFKRNRILKKRTNQLAYFKSTGEHQDRESLIHTIRNYAVNPQRKLSKKDLNSTSHSPTMSPMFLKTRASNFDNNSVESVDNQSNCNSPLLQPISATKKKVFNIQESQKQMMFGRDSSRPSMAAGIGDATAAGGFQASKHSLLLGEGDDDVSQMYLKQSKFNVTTSKHFGKKNTPSFSFQHQGNLNQQSTAMMALTDKANAERMIQRQNGPNGVVDPSILPLGSLLEQQNSELLKQLKRASPKDLRKILSKTLDEQAEMKWKRNQSGLKIQGQNLGYPLPDLSQEIKQLLLEMNAKTDPKPQMSNSCMQTEPQKPSQQEQRDGSQPLNTDLMNFASAELIGQITDSAVALDPKASTTDPNVLMYQINTGTFPMDQLQAEIQTLGAHESAEQRHENTAKRSSEGHKQLEKMPKSNLDVTGAKVTAGSFAKPQCNSHLSSSNLKDLLQQQVGGIVNELDVETNYLCQSTTGICLNSPNQAEEGSALKTVFQKRGRNLTNQDF